MAVRLVEAMEDYAEDAMHDFVYNDVVPAAKSFAPRISSKMANSIHPEQMDRFTWRVATKAEGTNGFAYPAHIESGQGVVPTAHKALHFKIRGRDILVKATHPSKRSGFMKKTVDYFK